MDFSEKLLSEYKKDADKKLALVCRIMMAFLLIVVVLEYFDIFIIAKKPVYIAIIVGELIFFAPTVLYTISGNNTEWVRFLTLALMVFESGMLYSVLSYHVIIMLVFPVVIACLYNQKKYVAYTSALSIVMIIASHLIAFHMHTVPDEPLITLKGVLLYGILPRLIEFVAVGIICFFITDRIEKLIAGLAQKNNELYMDQESLISSLSTIIEEKSETTGQHVNRVAEYTAILCHGLGYNDEDTWKISLAAMMHDVGKIMVPSEILEKPGKLTAEEFEKIKEHVQYGKRMLEKAPGELMKISKEIAYEHHERWDGKGYMGIKGEDINIYARCVSVADVFDALVSKRPYKKPWKPEDAFNEILAQKGKQFDPAVVDVFEKNFDKFVEVLKKYPEEETNETDNSKLL